jgi:hypothetical protein
MTTIELNIKEKFDKISPCLNERSRRIWVATEAKSIGWGGITAVFNATKVAQGTIRKGIEEIKNNARIESDRIRLPGGGRKKIQETYPKIIEKLQLLLEPETLGDPQAPLLWTSKSSYKLSTELALQGIKASQRTICDLVDNPLGYSIQGNRKTQEGKNHPDRDAQFKHINEKVKELQNKKQPVISVDTKKKENIGNFKNKGVDWRKKGCPEQVKTHDFIDKELGKVAPYGIYDITHNKGWVSVGIDHDTAEFAVQSIRSWWNEMGKLQYPDAAEILITADCGGSNGNRGKLWKRELQNLANELKMTINVCHFPAGTSKWNKIEHKMFCFISENWRGRPLIDRATVINLIGNTKSKTGLEIRAQLDENHYQKGIKVSDEEFKKLTIKPDDFHGEWNYKICPQNN